MDENANKPKHNIFALAESGNMKKEVFEKLGYDQPNNQLVPVEQDLVSTSSRSSRFTLDPLQGKPKAIEYLLKGAENKESVKDFINFSRQILMSQISINQKKEENERLNEYITMEQEKLDEAKKFQEEDMEKFEKLMDDTDKQVKRVVEEVKRAQDAKREITEQIAECQAREIAIDTRIKKSEDDLIEYKKDKHFLDILAFQATT